MNWPRAGTMTHKKWPKCCICGKLVGSCEHTGTNPCCEIPLLSKPEDKVIIMEAL